VLFDSVELNPLPETVTTVPILPDDGDIHVIIGCANE